MALRALLVLTCLTCTHTLLLPSLAVPYHLSSASAFAHPLSSLLQAQQHKASLDQVLWLQRNSREHAHLSTLHMGPSDQQWATHIERKQGEDCASFVESRHRRPENAGRRRVLGGLGILGVRMLM